MNDIETRLSRMLADHADDVTPHPDEALVAIAGRVTSTRRLGNVWRPLVALASAGVLVAGGIVVLDQLNSDRLNVRDGGVASEPGTTGGVAPGADAPIVSWEAVEFGAASELTRGRPNGVATTGNAILIAGVVEEPDSSVPVVWRSTDDTATWTKTPLVSDVVAGQFGEAHGIVTTADGVVRVVGEFAREAYVWTSVDAGATWTTQVLPTPTPVDFAAARAAARTDCTGTTVIVGEWDDQVGRRGAVWVEDPAAASGWSFEAEESSFVLGTEIVIYEIDALPTCGFVARGYGPGDTDGLAATWTSDDGRAWQVAQGANLVGRNLDAVLPLVDGRLAAIAVGDTEASAIVSDDLGATWQPMGEGFDLLPAVDTMRPRVGTLLLRAGQYLAPGQVTRDFGEDAGVVWSGNEQDGFTVTVLGGTDAVDAVPLRDGTVLVVGKTITDSDHLILWRGRS